MNKQNVLIIGAGLAGLMAGWQVASSGRNPRLIAKGWGTTHWHAGCVDVLGYYPTLVTSPAGTLPHLIEAEPQHPYALLGLERLTQALQAFQSLCAAAGYPLHGSLERNWLLPSAVGTFRPTCLAPETMIAGDLSDKSPMLIVGFDRFGDFYPNVVADNLSQQGVPAGFATLQLPTLSRRQVLTPLIFAQLMERSAFRAELVQALRPQLGQAARIGFPAVLGVENALAVKADLEAQLGRPVFEIPILPPSVPGIRLHTILRQAMERQGGRVYEGMLVTKAETVSGRIMAVFSEAAARQQAHRFEQYILATGGLLGGGLVAHFEGQVREVIFNLPVTAPAGRQQWFRQRFLDEQGHPIYRAGLTVDEQFRPVHESRPVYDNLRAAGTTLAHCDFIRERSLEGIALATGYVTGSSFQTDHP